ncbi:MAG: helix-hairpin-helix domain-containing protein [Candidatus Omnitrophota bacterium]
MFDLTPEERKVILFLLTIAIIGAGINFLAKVNAPLKNVIFLSPNIAKVNLNTADKDLLMSISGIGEKTAGRIIAYRKQQGAFASVDELRKIKGMNASRYEKIKDSVVLKQ